MKALRILLVAATLCGAGLTGRAAYLHAKAELAAVLIRRAWAETARGGRPHPPWSWADTHPVAVLRVPRIGYDEVVLEGATPRTLAFGPARMRSGAAPGEPGNMVLAGHRTSWFRPLEKLREGDTVELTWFDSRSRSVRQRDYIVEQIKVVAPEDVSLLAPSSGDALTLVTCYPFGAGPDSPLRFVARAAPTGPGRQAIPWNGPKAQVGEEQPAPGSWSRGPDLNR